MIVYQARVFWFCEELLERYKDDMRVGMISGDNFQKGIIKEKLTTIFLFIIIFGDGQVGLIGGKTMM